MNKRLNLATRPFNNRVLPWAVTAVLVVFSIFALLFIARATSEETAKAKGIQKDLDDLKRQELAIQKQVEEVTRALTPEQIKSLKAAHELVDRKRFSWTRLFGDLEAELPDSVRVARIAVRQVHIEGGRIVANLDLTVFARASTVVTDMIANMDRKGVFHAELRVQNLQKAKGESGSEYELDVQYTPRTGVLSDESARASVDTRATEQSGGAR